LGIRVSFYLGAPDGLEGHFWGSGPRQFRDWVRYVEEEHRGTFSPALLCRLDRIVAEDPSSLLPTDRADAEILDEVFDAFVGLYCTSADGLLRYASESMVYVGWYGQAQARIESQCSRQVSQCWSYLLDGRPMRRPSTAHPYTPRDPVFRLGYWTAEEVRIVHGDLRSTFPGVVQRAEQRSRGRYARTPDDEVAIEIAVEATARAMFEETGLITTVA
jgi:hypothetical protein